MRAVSAGLVASVLLASTAAMASPRSNVVRGGGGDSTRARELTVATPRPAEPAFAALAQHGWRASWDRRTGVPAWMWGGHVDVANAVTDAAIGERAAWDYLGAHLDVLSPGAAASDFVLLANHLDRGMRTVTFAQTWRGMRVLGGSIGFVIARDRLFAVYSAAWPDVSAAVPARAQTAQRAAQQRRIEATLAATARATGSRVIVPNVATASSAPIGYRVADVFDVRANQGPERWEVFADEHGEILAKRSTIMFASGKLEYNAGMRWGGGVRTTFPASAASILVNGASTMTASDGAFTWTGTASSSVVTGITGTYVRVINSAGASAMTTLSVAPGATAVWDASGSEFDDAQVSTYVYANIAKARARIINPAVSTWLDEQMDFYVNDLGFCNAYATADTVHLFRANASCENTGRVGDVVFHEFGHSLHAQSLISGIGEFQTDLSEGLSDFFAANITNDPGMGRGFFKSEEPLREIDPPGFERVYPADRDFDPHITGLIIGGALWDLRKALIADLGTAPGIARAERIFTGLMERADSIGTSFTPALLADDEDADLGNGTPNYCAIEGAFGRHGLVPGYVMTSVAPPVVTGRQLAVHVTTPSGTACPPLAVSSISVTWTANDGVASELSLAPSGDDWVGEFPEQPDGTLITYTVDVTFSDGSLTSLPNNEADPRYQLFVGEGVPLFCESFDADPGWEETSNLGREWQWGTLIVDPVSPDPDAPFTGTAAFGTDVAADGEYRPGLMTAIATPVITIPTFEIVRLQYRRWLTVEDAVADHAIIEANGNEVWRNASAPNGTLDHVDREWRFHDIDITPWITEGTLQLRWILDTDFSKELGGWTLDDVCVVGLAKIPYCGDNDLDLGEQCDDGNRESNDGCSGMCIDEVTAGGGGGCCSSSGGGASWLLALGVLGWIRRRRRRR